MEECPYCGEEISVYEFFMEVIVHGGNEPEFEYECEHCTEISMIDVYVEPVFNVRKKV